MTLVALPVEAEAADNSQNTEVNLPASKGNLSLSSNDLHVFPPNKKQGLCCSYVSGLLGQNCNSENIPVKNFHFLLPQNFIAQIVLYYSSINSNI